jgi:hypothetical protein
MTTFPYAASIEESMRVLYRSLRGNDRRRYAALEADKLGHGGDLYIAGVLECDPKTIRRGREELARMRTHPDAPGPDPRVRKKGAGARPRSRPSPS